MTLTRNQKAIGVLSTSFAVLYVILPIVSDPKADYGRYADLVDIASFAYLLVLPPLLGVASALILKGTILRRLFTMIYSLAPCMVVGLVVWGITGGVESVRVGMVLLAFVAALFLVAGAIASVIAAAARRDTPTA